MKSVSSFILCACLTGLLSGCGGGSAPAPAQLSLSIDHTSLPEGRVNAPYSQSVAMTAFGGTPPYVYSCTVSDGASGLSAAVSSPDPTTGSVSCIISGVPLTGGEVTVNFAVTDTKAFAYAGPLSISTSPSSDPLDNWHVRNSLPQGNVLGGVAYGNGTFVAVGDYNDTRVVSGTIFTSPDGITWTSKNLGTALSLNVVAYGNGIFVVGGHSFDTDSGVILTSQDGATWTSVDLGTNANVSLSSITYGNGTFIAVGTTFNNNDLTSGNILNSSDGIHWASRFINVSASEPTDLWGVTYGNGIFVAVGDWLTLGGPSAIIVTSTDGVTWAYKEIGASVSLTGVAYGNGIFVAGGVGILRGSTELVKAVLISTDGIVWEETSSTPISQITFGNGVFVAGGYNGTIFTSPDGITWTSRKSNVTADLTGLTYGNRTFVAVTFDGTIIQSDPIK